MQKLVKILILCLSIILLSSCAKPTVVNVVMPEDENLNCKQLEEQIIETQKIRREAEYAREGTGGNIARIMLFWPAWAQTVHNADKAVLAADDRKFHLTKIMKKKNCAGADELIEKITNPNVSSNASDSSENIARKLELLNELYISGALTKEEFEKAKKKTLSQ